MLYVLQKEPNNVLVHTYRAATLLEILFAYSLNFTNFQAAKSIKIRSAQKSTSDGQEI